MKKVLVRGPALSMSGYGEQCRFALRALRAHEDRFDIYLINTGWGRTGWIQQNGEERNWIDHLIEKTVHHNQGNPSYDISVQVTIPNEWEKLAPVNIGYTAGIETTKIAPHWLQPCSNMDRIVVVSEHAKFGFINTKYKATNDLTGEEVDVGVETPVDVVNYPVMKVAPKVNFLELPFDFNFLSVAQWGPRKNLDATIASFMEEFHDEEVGLLLKVNHAKNNLADKRLCESRLANIVRTYFPEAKCKIFLLHGNLTKEEMAGLYTHPKIKAMVTTTHGEGYGLPMFEAAYYGLPLAAPNWSGYVDFLYAPQKDKKGKERLKPHFVKIDYDLRDIQPEAVWEGVLVSDSKWCFVRKGAVKSSMRELYKNYGPHLSAAKKLALYLEENFTEERLYKQFADVIYKPEDVQEEWSSDLGEVSES